MIPRAKTFFVIFLSLWLSLATVGNLLEGVGVKIVEGKFTITVDGKQVVVSGIEIYPKGTPNRDFVVVGFHSFLLCSRSLKPLGIELARRGFYVFLPDLPGHGRNKLSLYIEFNSSDIGLSTVAALMLNLSFYNALIDYAKAKVGAEKVILIGHSMGGGFAIFLGAMRNDVYGVIVVSPTGVLSAKSKKEYAYLQDLLSANNPRNVLIAHPQFDEIHSIDYTLRVAEALGVENPEFEKVYGNFSEGTARKLIGLPLTDHFFGVQSAKFLSEAISWVRAITGLKFSSVVLESTRITLIWLALLFGILVLFLFGPALGEYFGLISGGRRWPRYEVKVKAYKCVILWPLITLLITGALALPLYLILYLMGYVVYFVSVVVFAFYIGSAIALLLLLKRYWNPQGYREVIRSYITELFKDSRPVLLGIAVILMMFAVFETTTGDLLFSNIPTQADRWLSIAVSYPFALIVFSIPYDMLYRRYIQEAFGGGTVRAAILAASLSTASRIILFVLLALIIGYIAGLYYFATFVFTLLLFVQFVSEILAATLYLATREITPEAVSNSFFWLVVAMAATPSFKAVGIYLYFLGFAYTA